MDGNGLAVGAVLDGYNGLAMRQVGRDRLLIRVTGNEIVPSSISFFHTTPDCSGLRYVSNMNGAGLLPYALVAGSQLVFTRLVDPDIKVALPTWSIEAMDPGQDLTVPGTCLQLWGYPQSMGEAVVVSDRELASLVPPFRIE